MKRFAIYEMLFLLLITSGCSAYSSDMSGTVVDAETGKPIEGAVVLVEWTKTKGIGLTHTESYKIQEVLTDKEGKFDVSGVSNPFVNAPDITVYKKGYVCWNNKFIFPDYRNRPDFRWEHEIMVKLDHFYEKKYSYSDHVMFIHGSINFGLPGSNKKIIEEAIRWEEFHVAKKRSQSKLGVGNQ